MVNGKFPLIPAGARTMRRFDTKGEEYAYTILNSFSDALNNRFQECKASNYDANTKGGQYEKVVSKFMETYFGGVLDFHTRAQVLDISLNCLRLFRRNSNNFDVVATFRAAIPRLIYSTGDITFVPLDSVALVAEVKDTLTKTFLKDDLEKLKLFSDLPFSVDRFYPLITKENQVPRPLRLLVYGSKSINDRTLFSLMMDYRPYWDILVVVETDQIWDNLQMDLKGNDIFYCPIRAMYQAAMAIAKHLPTPISVDVYPFFSNLLLIGEP